MPWKRGNQPWNLGLKAQTPLVGESSCTSNDSGTVSKTTPERLVRPERDIYDAAKLPGIITPSKLRPHHSKLSSVSADSQNLDSAIDSSSTENVIVGLGKLTELVQMATFHSDWHSFKCDNFLPVVEVQKRMGLCISLVCKCAKCNCESAVLNMFEKGSRVGKRGPCPGSLNQTLTLPVAKTKAGANDLTFFLASLNIKAPRLSGMYRNINNVCDKIVDINRKSLIENQTFVAKVNQLRGESNCISAEQDSSFNNRIAAGYEAGTQSFTPLVEQQTNRKLVVEMSTANKLCLKRNCKHDTVDCKKNYKTEDSISSTETKSGIINLQSLHSGKILKVSNLTCDAGTQVPGMIKKAAKILRQHIRQFTCFIHHIRTFTKHIKNIKITSEVQGGKDTYMQKLSSSFRQRVYQEITRFHKRNLPEDVFISKSIAAVLNVLPCLEMNTKTARRSHWCVVLISKSMFCQVLKRNTKNAKRRNW